jgi:hypothetical protein
MNARREAMMEVCLEKKEQSPEGIESNSEHQEVPKEEAAMKTVGALKDKYGRRHLDMGCCRQPRHWGIPEEVDRLPQTNNPPCRSCTA